jgi:GDP-4-dehydro-6-deoxy-D-mannose reductase
LKILVTGAGGFVGRWLVRELVEAGHEVVAPEGRAALDVTDAGAVREAMAATEPDAVAHLAAISLASAARADPGEALRVTVGGTVNVLEAARMAPSPPALLVVGSAEVYGTPDPSRMPLREDVPLAPRSPYAISKAAQEGLALAYAARWRLPLVVTRSFNHSGAGQRPGFVVPDLAGRVRAVRDGQAAAVRVGNLSVRRDFSDVRDVARAYRLLLEALADGRIGAGGAVFNVASGQSVEIGEILRRLCELAGIAPQIEVDQSLVRAGEAPDITGDATALMQATGWRPQHDLGSMLASAWQAVMREATTDATATAAPTAPISPATSSPGHRPPPAPGP